MTDSSSNRDDASSQGAHEQSFGARVEALYYFSIESAVRVLTADRRSAGPSGARLHIVYDGDDSKVYSDKSRFAPELSGSSDPFQWRGLKGRISSGADFCLARLDGVLELDGRITIQAQDGCLIDLEYDGRIDLASIVPGQLDPITHGLVLDERVHGLETGLETGLEAGSREQPPSGRDGPKLRDKDISRALQQRESNLFRSFLDCRIPNAPIDVPVTLRLRFEAASTPSSSAPGEDLSWVSRRYLKHEGNFWRYRRLVRKSFVALGKIRFDAPGPEGISDIAFDVFELRVDA